MSALLIGIAGLVLAGGAIWANRAFGNRRGKLKIAVSRTDLLLLSGSMAGDLEVRAGGRALARPTLYRVSFENVGPIDLSSERFDQGQPILVVSPAVIAAARSFSTPSPVELDADSHPTRMSIRPGLLARGQSWRLEFVVDAGDEQMVEFLTPLVDFDVTYVGSSSVRGPAAG
jgi:hypothetical protein